jgi:hypothetical protein
MAIQPEKIQEIVEKNTFPNGTVDWPAVAHEVNEQVLDQLDEAANEMTKANRRPAAS